MDARLTLDSIAWKEIQDFDLINPLQKSENWSFMESDDEIRLPENFAALTDSDKKNILKALAKFTM